MVRQQVLKLYRSFLQAIREVPNEESKKELLEWIHSDFKNNKHHTDEVRTYNFYIRRLPT